MVLLAALVCAACTSNVPAVVVTQRLVVAMSRFIIPGGSPPNLVLTAIDRETLSDVVGTSLLELPPCTAGPIVSRAGDRVVVIENGMWVPGPMCPERSQLKLRVLDVATWSWEREFELAAPADRVLELAWTVGEPPVVWSADGARLYVFTASRRRDWAIGAQSPDEVRQLWMADVQSGGAPIPVTLDAAPWRVTLAPSGLALYVLGYNTLGPSRWGYLDPGSTVLSILDPATGSTRTRIPLPGVKVARSLAGPPSPAGAYSPGVAVAPNGRYYYVAHADEPIVEVVDVFASGFERVERAITTEPDSAHEASSVSWLSLSPDGQRLFASRGQPPPLAVSRQPMQVVDTHTWAVAPFHPAADYVQFSPNGAWLYTAGAGLRVLEAPSGRQIAMLAADQPVLQIMPSRTNRLLYLVVGHAADAGQLAPPIAFDGPLRSGVELVAYEVETWQERARRVWPFPLWLARPVNS
jgi:hypothetical protein